MKSEIYQSQTGSKINLYSIIPNNEVKAIIHISHGMVEHALRYKRFANELCKSGYAVYTHDIRGHVKHGLMMRLKAYLPSQTAFN
jgi:alpha-beta hydrolase superfamily lysophospholipase